MPHPAPSLWTDRPDDWDAAAAPPAPPPRRPDHAPTGGGRGPLATALVVAALAATGGGAYALGSSDDAAPAAAATTAAGTGAPAPKTDVGKVYAQVSAGVVSVRAGSGSGSGFVYDADGTIVTNDHVVGEARQVQVRFDDDGPLVDARVVGTDPSTDLAVLKVDPSDAGALRVLKLAPSADVAVGDAAIAVGYPLGLDRTATAGIISGLEREIEAPNGYRIDEVLQTDAPINPGNSGGPLLDARGRVIGVNSQIATAGSQGNVGIGFAVPSDTVKEVVPKLLAGQTIERPYLGVSTAETPTGGGAQVGAVTAGSPAERAGLREGDVIIAVGDQDVADPDAVAGAIADKQPGDRLAVTFTRDGDRRSVEVTLGTRPEAAP